MNETNPVACSLADRECVPCRGGVPPLKDAALKALADQLGPAWQVVDEHHLEKKFRFPDFRQALAFADRVGEFADSVNHHPELTVGWGFARVSVWTHAIDGLCESDFIFAAKVDALE